MHTCMISHEGQEQIFRTNLNSRLAETVTLKPHRYPCIPVSQIRVLDDLDKSLINIVNSRQRGPKRVWGGAREVKREREQEMLTRNFPAPICVYLPGWHVRDKLGSSAGVCIYMCNCANVCVCKCECECACGCALRRQILFICLKAERRPWHTKGRWMNVYFWMALLRILLN